MDLESLNHLLWASLAAKMLRRLAGLLELLKMAMNKSVGRMCQETGSKSLFAFTKNNLFRCNNFISTNNISSMH